MSTGKKVGLGCLGCFGLIILVIIISIAASSGKKDSNTQSVNNGSKTTEASATPSTEYITISNSSAKKDAAGYWEVVGEAKNNDTTKHSATIKATFYKADGSIMGTALGAINDIDPGNTKTFNLMSTDDVTGYANMKVQVDTLL